MGHVVLRPAPLHRLCLRPDYCVAKGMEIYGHEYAISFPRHAWPAGRDRKLSPIHDRIAALGAQFNAYNGWERATWYAKPGDDISEAATQTFRRDGPWQKRIREECLAVRDAAGILDLPGFSRFRLQGQGARDWLASLITGIVPKPGRIGLGYFADDTGRIVTEMSIMALAEDFFFLITAAVAEWHDFEWLQKHLPQATGMTLENATERFHLPDPVRPEVARHPRRRDRRRSLAALAVASVLPDRRALAAAGPRLLRRRARLGTAHQGRGHGGRSSTRCGQPARSTG